MLRVIVNLNFQVEFKSLTKTLTLTLTYWCQLHIQTFSANINCLLKTFQLMTIAYSNLSTE